MGLGMTPDIKVYTFDEVVQMAIAIGKKRLTKIVAQMSQDELLNVWHECRRKHGLELCTEDEQFLEELKGE